MRKGSKGERRPADVIGAAVKVAKIATGKIEEKLPQRSAAASASAPVGRRSTVTMSGNPSNELPKYDPARRDIPGRVKIVLSAVLSVLTHDVVDLGVGKALPKDVPLPSEETSFLEKATNWLQRKLDPPKKSN